MVLKIWHCFLALQAFQLKSVLSASRQPPPPPNQNSAAFGTVFTSSHCFKVEQSNYSEKNGKLMQHAHRKVEKKVDEQHFLIHRQTSERTNVRTTNVRTTNVRKDKRQKRQTSERTNVRSDKRQKRQTSEGTNVRKTNVGKTSEKNVRKTSENHNIIYTINILIFWRLSFLTFVIWTRSCYNCLQCMQL